MSQKTYRIIALTGPPGCGKTTLVKKVCHQLNEKNFNVVGFFTEEVRKEKKRIGFDVVLLSGERGPLATLRSGNAAYGSANAQQPYVGRYAVNLKSFEELVMPALKCYDKSSILVLDEIGKMELYSKQFEEFVLDCCLHNKENVILATIPQTSKTHMPTVALIKKEPDTIVLEVDMYNRNALEQRIMEYIMSAKTKNCNKIINRN